MKGTQPLSRVVLCVKVVHQKIKKPLYIQRNGVNSEENENE